MVEVGSATVYLDGRDAWLGVYDDVERKIVYVCPVPFLVIRYVGSPRTAGFWFVVPALLLGSVIVTVGVPLWVYAVQCYLLCLGGLTIVLSLRRLVMARRAAAATKAENGPSGSANCPRCGRS